MGAWQVGRMDSGSEAAQMTRAIPCPQCGAETFRVAKYDTFGCKSCLIWTEERHTEDSCSGCPYDYPPERPSEEDLK